MGKAGAHPATLVTASLRWHCSAPARAAHLAQAQAWLRSRHCDALCEMLDLNADQVRQLVRQDLQGLRHRLGKM